MPVPKILFKNMALLSIFVIMFSHCNNDSDYAQIPNVYVNYDINLNLPQYSDLTNYGGYVYIDNEGYKGLIIYHSLSDEYMALERTCTFEPLKDCSVIYVDSSGIMLRCGQKDGDCCDSKFEMDGSIISGPALYPLKKYYVSRNGDILTISNSF